MNPNRPLIDEPLMTYKALCDTLNKELTISDARVASLTTENQSLKEQRDKLVELLNDAVPYINFSINFRKTYAEDEQHNKRVLKEITSFLKENQL